MANPRKFSEKIALHNQKQAEETAAFEKIMQEVSAATSRPEETSLSPQFGVGATSPARSPGQRGRTSSSGGPMRRPAERKHDTSPYGSTAYLSPPDSSWRRTNSDSALHQSCGEQPPAALSPHHPHHSHAHPHQPHQSRRNEVHLDVFNNMAVNPNIRPRSSCGIPRIPNNTNMYETVGGLGGTLSCDHQMPGGSLPDLTSVHYPPSHPAYQPHTRPHYHHPGQGGPGPGPGGSGSPATGGLSPGSGSPVGATVPPPLDALHTALRHDPALYDTQNRLSVPNTNNYLHQNKNISPLDQSWISSSYQSNCSPPSQYSSTSNINIPSPTIVHSPGSPAEQQPQTDYSNYHLIDQFEQITMMDPPTTQNTQYSTSYINHSSPHSPQTTNSPHTYSQSPHRSSPNLSGSGTMGSIHSAGDCRSRHERDPLSGGNYPALQPLTSPATPASIPDIVIGDYSGDLDGGIFGGEESELRAGLDLDELTLLEEPNALLPDSAVEHEFRAEHEYLGGL